MGDVDDFMEEFHRAPRSRKSPQCEARTAYRRDRCGRGAKYVRDGHKVCKVHLDADYPLEYVLSPKS